jgi:hypothetical protein
MMDRDTLLLMGVIVIVLIVLGSAYTVMYRGVAPSLLGTYTEAQKTQQASQTQTTGTQAAPFSFGDRFLSIREFSVNYDLEVNMSKIGKLSVYLKGDKYRLDLSMENIQYTIIRSGNSNVVCSKPAGEDWSCLQSGSVEEAIQSTGEENLRDPVGEGSKLGSPSYNGSRNYAGQKGYCYYAKETSGELEVLREVCITDKGVPVYYLYMEKTNNIITKRIEAIAKTISSSVQDNVFNPPAAPS